MEAARQQDGVISASHCWVGGESHSRGCSPLWGAVSTSCQWGHVRAEEAPHAGAWRGGRRIAAWRAGICRAAAPHPHGIRATHLQAPLKAGATTSLYSPVASGLHAWWCINPHAKCWQLAPRERQ